MEKRKLRKIRNIIKQTEFNGNLLKFGKNLFSHKLYRILNLERVPWPSTFSLELTNKCNLHCIMCPREYEYGKCMVPGEMPTDLAKKLVDETYPYVQSMGLTGMGETLFAPNLVEVASYIKSKKKSIVIFISTNANFPDFIDKARNVLPYIDTIQVSTDGVGETYESVRKGASFSLLEHNLSQLVPMAQKENVDVMLNMVVNKRNFISMAPLIEFAALHDIKYVRLTPINLVSIPSIHPDYYEFFASPEFIKERDRAIEICKKYPDIEVTGLNEHNAKTSIKECPFMWNHYQVNYDGEVPPCCAKPFSKEYSFGNVNDKSLKDVLNSEAALKFRYPVKKGKAPEFCKNCTFVNL